MTGMTVSTMATSKACSSSCAQATWPLSASANSRSRPAAPWARWNLRTANINISRTRGLSSTSRALKVPEFFTGGCAAASGFSVASALSSG